MKKIFYPLLLIALFACNSGQKQPVTETATAVPDSTAADTTTIAGDDAQAISDSQVDGMTAATSKPNEVILNGTITLPPQKNATVSLTMGGIVKHTSLLSGQFIQRGAIVATIENPDFITLQQTYLESHAQTEFLRTEYERQKALAANEAASQKKLQQSKADYLAMQSKLQSAAAQLSLLGVTPNSLLKNGIQQMLIVRAPISGYVANITMNIGKYMHSGDPLCDIIDKSGVMLCLTTYEKDIPRIKAGDGLVFHVNGMGDQEFSAVVVSIGQNVSQTNRSVEIYARITKNNPDFRPGLYVTARFLKNK